MIRKCVPNEVWDYGLKWVSETMSLTHTSAGSINGQIPLTHVTGDTADTDNRRRMTTVMIQVILFLKENRNLWNDNVAYQSLYNCQQNTTNRRRHEKEEQFLEQRHIILRLSWC